MNGDEGRPLRTIELLRELDDAALRRLEQRCRWRRCKPRERIIDFGEGGGDVYFITEGAVSVVNVSDSGREIAFATVEAGDIFGELSAVDGQPRSASVIATEAARVAILPAADFVHLLKDHGVVAFKLVERLARMVRAGDRRIMELSTLAAGERVYAELLRMAQPDAATAGLWVVRSLPPLREIASRVSTTRETVARAVSQATATGLLRRKGRNLYLMDRAKLEELVSAMNYAKRGAGRDAG